MEIPYASIKDYLESNTVTLTAKLVGVTNPTTFTVTYGAVNENGHDLPIQTDKIGDNYGNVVHLFDRDCSVQRRHQKVVEYAPAFTIPDETREKIFDAAIRLCKNVGYVNAGTLEFLVDRDNNPYFIE